MKPFKPHPGLINNVIINNLNFTLAIKLNYGSHFK